MNLEPMTSIPSSLLAVGEAFVLMIAVLTAVLLARNVAIIRNYKELVESQEKRIDDLQRAVDVLRDRDSGYQIATTLLIEAITESGLCESALHCLNRRPPQNILKRFSDAMPQRRVGDSI